MKDFKNKLTDYLRFRRGVELPRNTRNLQSFKTVKLASVFPRCCHPILNTFLKTLEPGSKHTKLEAAEPITVFAEAKSNIAATKVDF